MKVLRVLHTTKQKRAGNIIRLHKLFNAACFKLGINVGGISAEGMSSGGGSGGVQCHQMLRANFR